MAFIVLYELLDYHLELLDFTLLARIARVVVEDSACGKKTLLSPEVSYIERQLVWVS